MSPASARFFPLLWPRDSPPLRQDFCLSFPGADAYGNNGSTSIGSGTIRSRWKFKRFYAILNRESRQEVTPLNRHSAIYRSYDHALISTLTPIRVIRTTHTVITDIVMHSHEFMELVIVTSRQRPPDNKHSGGSGIYP